MDVIQVRSLVKEFKAKVKGEGLSGSIKAIFSPKYSRVKAVDNVSFSVKRGEIVGFIGPNGAGKSTTIKMMTGILFPDSGEISVLGFNPQKERKKLSYEIGTVFGQKPQLWYHLPAIDTFNLFAEIYELDRKKYRARLRRLVKVFGVEKIINTPVRKLSLGQRMRCEMIASLLHRPKVLFLDEPTIGLDIVVKKKIRELTRQLNTEENISIILTSHDMEDVEQICDRLVIINGGKVVYDGSTASIRERFLKYKIIKVVLARAKSGLGVKGARVVFRGKFHHTIEVDSSKRPVKDVVREIFSKHEVEDISILDPPIEEIIERIFKWES